MRHRYTLLFLACLLLCSSATAQHWSLELAAGPQFNQVRVPEVMSWQHQATAVTLRIDRQLSSRWAIGLSLGRTALPVMTRFAGQQFSQAHHSPIICCFGPCNFPGDVDLAADYDQGQRETFWSALAGARYIQPLAGKLFARFGLAGGFVRGNDLDYQLTNHQLGYTDAELQVLEYNSVDNRLSPSWQGTIGLGWRLNNRYTVGLEVRYQETRLRSHRVYESTPYLSPWEEDILDISSALPWRQWQLGVVMGYRWNRS